MKGERQRREGRKKRKEGREGRGEDGREGRKGEEEEMLLYISAKRKKATEGPGVSCGFPGHRCPRASNASPGTSVSLGNFRGSI